MRGFGIRRIAATLFALILGAGLMSAAGPPPAAARQQAGAVPGTPPEAGQWYKVRGRLVDGQTITAGTTLTVKVTGRRGIPASDVGSVAINIAAKGLNGNGQIIAYPSGVAMPDTTMMRYRRTLYHQNLVFLKVGADGYIKLTNNMSSDVIIYADAHGYTTSTAGSTAGSTFVPVKPERIGKVTVPANGTAQVAPLGKAGIPSSGVSDVLFTMSGKSDTAGKLTVYPSDGVLPGDTNLDYGLNVLVQNQVIGQVGADGKLEIANAGAKAITVSLDAAGYFATPTTAVKGAAIHAITPDRLANDVRVPAGGTHTLAPLGHGGVPTSGVSGVYLNITNVHYVGSGVLRVYPAGTTPAETHAVTFQEAMAYSGALPAKLGEDGKITILNDGSSELRLWVDQFAYFKEPVTGCTNPSPATEQAASPPSISIDSYTPTAVMQSSPIGGASQGALQFAYTDNIGRLLHGTADPAALSQVQWTVINDNEAFTGQPALGEQKDGRLQVLAHNTGGNVWTKTQATRYPPVWDSWVNVEKPMVSHVTVTQQDDALVAFAVDAGGTLWALPQYAPNDAYQGWIDLGMTGLSTASTPVAVPVADGVQVFALDAAGTWRTALYARGTVSECASLSGPGFSGQAAVVSYPGDRLRIFVRSADGHILTKMRDGSGNFPQEWEQVGDLIAAGSPSALLSPVSGKTEILVRGTDDKIHSTGETLQGTGDWRPWTDAQGASDPYEAATDPTAFEYMGTNGPTWAFLFRTDNQETRMYMLNVATNLRSAGTTPNFTGHSLPKPPAAR
ncbi:hypothetical protein [Actinomadura sp. 3N407]|uniref:hypothetical protein n=1 Tax=Actinomadura sp. 3N407 TaxID=3457423 RepID=UPI003FCE914F